MDSEQRRIPPIACIWALIAACEVVKAVWCEVRAREDGSSDALSVRDHGPHRHNGAGW